jgi:hypothetical protein
LQPVTKIFEVTKGKAVLFLSLEELSDDVLDRFVFQDVDVMSRVKLESLGERDPKFFGDIGAARASPRSRAPRLPALRPWLVYWMRATSKAVRASDSLEYWRS